MEKIIQLILLIVANIWMNHVTKKHAYNMGKKINKFGKLPDTLQDKIIPDKICKFSKKAKKVVDKFYIVFLVTLTFYLSYSIFKSKNYNHVFEGLSFMLYINLLRCVFYSCTILPDCSQKCKFAPSSFRGSCNDLVFSGHVAILLAVIMLLVNYKYIGGYSITFISVIFAGISFHTIASCNHYTIDVLTAIVLTIKSFYAGKYFGLIS